MILGLGSCTRVRDELQRMIVNSQDDTCVVFNPRPGKLAMLCIYMQDGDVVTAHRLIEAMPFAGALNEKMWL